MSSDNIRFFNCISNVLDVLVAKYLSIADIISSGDLIISILLYIIFAHLSIFLFERSYISVYIVIRPISVENEQEIEVKNLCVIYGFTALGVSRIIAFNIFILRCYKKHYILKISCF